MTLSPEAQLRYYSAWYYSAIHVAVSIPRFRTREALVTALGLDSTLVDECLNFLIEQGLVTVKGGHFLIGPARMHLGADSPIISKLHANWRLKALQSLERPMAAIATDLHYSTVITLSKADVNRVREVLLRAIEETDRIFRPSPEEVVYCVGIDWFKISKEE